MSAVAQLRALLLLTGWHSHRRLRLPGWAPSQATRTARAAANPSRNADADAGAAVARAVSRRGRARRDQGQQSGHPSGLGHSRHSRAPASAPDFAGWAERRCCWAARRCCSSRCDSQDRPRNSQQQPPRCRRSSPIPRRLLWQAYPPVHRPAECHRRRPLSLRQIRARRGGPRSACQGHGRCPKGGRRPRHTPRPAWPRCRPVSARTALAAEYVNTCSELQPIQLAL